MVKFDDRMVTDVVQTFWAARARGEFITGAAAEVGTYRGKGRRWLRESGGVRPRRGRDLLGRCLTFSEREEIALAPAPGQGVRQMARSLWRSASSISRELARNVEGAKSYRATTAHALAYERVSRPKPAKLVRLDHVDHQGRPSGLVLTPLKDAPRATVRNPLPV